MLYTQQQSSQRLGALSQARAVDRVVQSLAAHRQRLLQDGTFLLRREGFRSHGANGS